MDKNKEFINKAQLIHKDFYNYSLVNYINAHTKVSIICPNHGIFEQIARKHYQGQGCPLCYLQNKKKYSTNEFILESQKIHKNNYNYDLVKYLNKDQYVKIQCNKCLIYFKQTPKVHLNNNKEKCPNCNFNYKKEEIIKKLNIIHNNKYDYSLMDSLTHKSKIEIICPIHGNFTQLLSAHIYNKQGCPSCSGNKKLTNETFIQKSNIVHNKKYNYSLIKYINNSTPVHIICPIHGKFYQKPVEHLLGSGCSKCNFGGFDMAEKSILYYISIDNGTFYKIGITNKNVLERFKKEDLNRIKIIKEWFYEYGYEAYKNEQIILKEFSYALINNLEILKNGNTEIFNRDVLLLDS